MIYWLAGVWLFSLVAWPIGRWVWGGLLRASGQGRQIAILAFCFLAGLFVGRYLLP